MPLDNTYLIFKFMKFSVILLDREADDIIYPGYPTYKHNRAIITQKLKNISYLSLGYGLIWYKILFLRKAG